MNYASGPEFFIRSSVLIYLEGSLNLLYLQKKEKKIIFFICFAGTTARVELLENDCVTKKSICNDSILQTSKCLFQFGSVTGF